MKQRWIVGVSLALACAVGCASVVAQSTEEPGLKTRLNEVASSFTTSDTFMGTVLVTEGDHLILNKGYGMADLEWGNANAPDVKFRIGSLTKQFTATLVLLLQQEGKLKIDDPVGKYLTDSPRAWDGITLANLLGHTSGIPNFTDFKEFDTWRMNPHSVDEILAFFRGKPLDFRPGGEFRYSNSNYEVLGAVIEKVSGRHYGDLLREQILDPLGMKDTGLDTDELILPKRAQGYMPGSDGLVPARSESMTVPWAAGSIYSTTGDLLKWEHGLFGGRVLSADSLKAMTTPGKGDYGLGVMIAKKGPLTAIEHVGGVEGFNTILIYVPERRIAVVVLSNVNGEAPAAMGLQLLDVMLGNPVTLASERKARPISKEALSRFVGVYDQTPDSTITVAFSGDDLTAQATGEPALRLLYLGVKDGRPRFYIRQLYAELEFVPDANGVYRSLVLHQAIFDVQATRH